MILFSFPGFETLGAGLVKDGRFAQGDFTSDQFANGEEYITTMTDVSGRDCVVIGSVAPPARTLVQFLLLCDTLSRQGATSITAVLPYLAYGRQDRQRTGVSQATAWLGTMLAAVGVNSVVTIDAHDSASVSSWPMPVQQLSAVPLWASMIQQEDWQHATIVAPDEGTLPRCRAVAALTGNPVAYFHKERTLQGVQHGQLYGSVGAEAIVIDDMLDTGGTLLSCCARLKALGITTITVMVTHGLFTGIQWQGLWAQGVQRIIYASTVPVVEHKADARLQSISVAPLLATALEQHRANMGAVPEPQRMQQ